MATVSDHSCLRCSGSVEPQDRYCRHCGAALQLSDNGSASEVLTVREVEVLPAVRADLAPYVPVVARAALVVAGATFADWALRKATHQLLADGLALLGRSPTRARQGRASGRGVVTREETVVLEQRLLFRQ